MILEHCNLWLLLDRMVYLFTKQHQADNPKPHDASARLAQSDTIDPTSHREVGSGFCLRTVQHCIMCGLHLRSVGMAEHLTALHHPHPHQVPGYKDGGLILASSHQCCCTGLGSVRCTPIGKIIPSYGSQRQHPTIQLCGTDTNHFDVSGQINRAFRSISGL
jgi:hypothetical protein